MWLILASNVIVIQINFNSENAPHCVNFDINLATNDVKCIRAGFGGNDNGNFTGNDGRSGRQLNGGNPAPKIVDLKRYFGTKGLKYV